MPTDILEELPECLDCNCADCEYGIKAAAEIRRLREDIANRPIGWEEMVAEIYDLREQVQGLKEALEFIAADDYGPKNRVYHPARAKQALAKLGGDDDTATD